MTIQEAYEIVKKVSSLKFTKCSEYEDAFLFEVETEYETDGGNVAVVLKKTKEVVNLTTYILKTYRDLEEDLIKQYKL